MWWNDWSLSPLSDIDAESRLSVSASSSYPPWLLPVLVGAGLRVACGALSIGYFAADDSKNVLEPAWVWLASPDAAYPSEIRSSLFARLIGALFWLGDALGVKNAISLLKLSYLLLGLYSLIAIPAVFALSRRLFGLQAARYAAWLMAAYALMPRLSTYALIGVAAIPLVTLGFACLIRASQERSAISAVAGGLCLALASMIRFQSGLLFLAGAGLWALDALRCRESWLRWWALVAGGGLGLALQATWDGITRGAPLESLWMYLDFNLRRASEFGTSPWYAYVPILVLLTLPPCTLAIAPALLRAVRRAPLVSVPLGVYVVAHSLIPHKEERFLFSILPLLWVLFGAALAERSRVTGWLGINAVRGFALLNLVLLIPATLSDGNRATVVPLAETVAMTDVARIVVVGRFVIPTLYLDRRTAVVRLSPDRFPRGFETLGPLPQTSRLLFVEPPLDAQLNALRTYGLRCEPARTYPGDWLDQLLVWLNPRGNRRRRSRYAVDCEAVL